LARSRSRSRNMISGGPWDPGKNYRHLSLRDGSPLLQTDSVSEPVPLDEPAKGEILRHKADGIWDDEIPVGHRGRKVAAKNFTQHATLAPAVERRMARRRTSGLSRVRRQGVEWGGDTGRISTCSCASRPHLNCGNGRCAPGHGRLSLRLWITARASTASHLIGPPRGRRGMNCWRDDPPRNGLRPKKGRPHPSGSSASSRGDDSSGEIR